MTGRAALFGRRRGEPFLDNGQRTSTDAEGNEDWIADLYEPRGATPEGKQRYEKTARIRFRVSAGARPRVISAERRGRDDHRWTSVTDPRVFEAIRYRLTPEDWS